MRKISVFFLFLMLLPGTTFAAPPLKIIASFSILGDLARQIGGSHVLVTSLVGPDGDAHSFEPRPGDAALLAGADLVIINGLKFEEWMERLVAASGYKGRILVASDGISNSLGMEEAGRTIADPHAWQDIGNARLYAHNIASALATLDPGNKEDYQQNAARLDKELAEIDQWIKAQIASIPAEKRLVISSHDAFGYFARAYGVKFIAPVGLSTEEEPSAKTLKHITEQIRQASAHTLFWENMSDPKLIRQLATEAGAKIGAQLYADALSEPNGPAGTYQAMMKYNVGELVKAMRQ